MPTKTIHQSKHKFLLGIVKAFYTVTDTAPQLGKYTGIDRYHYCVQLRIFGRNIVRWDFYGTNYQRQHMYFGD